LDSVSDTSSISRDMLDRGRPDQYPVAAGPEHQPREVGPCGIRCGITQMHGVHSGRALYLGASGPT
jgi:hypothetical protein